MKKHGILNSELAKVVDDLGHTDQVCIGDLGLPVPKGIKKIDLAVKHGLPTFQDILDVYLENVLVEKVFLAEEIKSENPDQLKAILDKLGPQVEIVYLTHEALKAMNTTVKAVVRTGEDTPYSNIILQSGVTL
ncbi:MULTISPECIES: D-ribose pyranase [unclassified Lactococcus]|uniref:D-ribose pyranase n=1 Tax=unclassified Lactococcus TaxID=2643510 RepID=UPI0011CADE45|nr:MULTISPECIES: D-ribose pyranase [unclassified Lactococcus]MQW22601.1 D-ribose pyranase [Lactococcus sp. dk101]TXK45622.1 D-ribose pyranase [Lactococcus sp. dk310]TXK51473.1 D-ribose pyranase [Lactococcus sp. dk322]